MMPRLSSLLLLVSSLAVGQTLAPPSTPSTPSPALLISESYLALPNVVYARASNYEAKLDLYRPAASKIPTPVVVVIHGGGWVNGTKEEIVTALLPYME